MVLVVVGSGFVIFGTGCDRVQFSVVVGTIWLWYRTSGCSGDYFRGMDGYRVGGGGRARKGVGFL